MSIFWDFSNYDKIELLPCPIITTGTQDMGNGVYKLAAGTPLKKSTQAVSNDGNADCVVAEDYFFIATKADQNKLVPVITKGYVDKALAEAAWGGTFADAAVSALETAGIFLVDGALETGGGDPGYDVETTTIEIIPEQTVSVEPGGGSSVPYAMLTLAEGVDAPPESLTVVLDGVEHETTRSDVPIGSMYMADDESFDVVIGHVVPGDPTLFAAIEGNLSGSITVEASTTEEVVTVSDEFKAAVEASVPSPSGGGDVFAVTFTYDAQESWSCDKTYDEVQSAFNAGQNVIGFCAQDSGGSSYYSYASTYALLSELGAEFYFCPGDSVDSGFRITFHGEYISRSDLPGSRLVVISSWSSDDGKYVLDQTWEDIADAYAAGIPVYIHEFGDDGVEHGFFLVNGVRSIDTGGGVYAYVVVGFNPINSGDFGRNIISYTADIESGYPAGNYPLQ